LRDISLQQVLDKDLVTEFQTWLECIRGSSAGSCRKVIQHLSSIASFVLMLFPHLKSAYGNVPDLYRRLSNQLALLDAQEAKTQSDLIREGSWLPFPVIVELAANRRDEFDKAVEGGASKEECTERALEAAVITLLSFRSWRSGELTSLELVTPQELVKLAKKCGFDRSQYLKTCGRNFIIQYQSPKKWMVLTNTYKTSKTYHCLEETLLPEESRVIETYLAYRKYLLNGHNHKFLFVGRNGRQLNGSGIADMFERLTNVRLLCNVRRKATVTWALSQQGLDRESFARLMRHSQRQQSAVYDQRTGDVRTSSALNAVRGLNDRLGLGDESPSHLKSLKLGESICFLSSDKSTQYGKVINLSNGGSTVTVLTFLQQDGEVRSLFGDVDLLKQFSIYQIVETIAVL